jgi:hypothetical protein
MFEFLLGIVVQGGTLRADVRKVTSATIALMNLSDCSKEDIKRLIVPACADAVDVDSAGIS